MTYKDGGKKVIQKMRQWRKHRETAYREKRFIELVISFGHKPKDTPK